MAEWFGTINFNWEMTMTTRTQSALWRLGVYLGIAMLIALCVTAKAGAQTVTAEATVSWTLPATDTLGDPLTGEHALQKIRLYVSTSPIEVGTTIVPIELPPVAQSFAYESEVPNGSTLYFRVDACNAICSGLSNQATKEIRVSVPNVPTGVTVSVRVNLNVTARPDDREPR